MARSRRSATTTAAPERAGELAAAGQQFVKRGSREHAIHPHADLLERRCHDALLDTRVHRGAKAPAQQAQQRIALALAAAFLSSFLAAFLSAFLAAFLAAFLSELLSSCHDGFLGFGSNLTFKKCFQCTSFDVVVDF